ncbi:hypothetical protein [Psychroserpens damuponensis]|uniref:hypothetical protein n=1 Tax=Psychroserpens damuponensis TaxID=943936 RepID=UPI000694C7D5|nr:hypothetical protein [Psychroserpens damuponensis]
MKSTITFVLILGVFSQLFGQSNKKKVEASSKHNLKLEYNVMKNITLKKNKAYKDSERYEFIENGIYRDLKNTEDTTCSMTISYELESNDSNNQYPLEDILDKYVIYVSDAQKSENKPNTNTYILELSGQLEDLKKAKEIIGKKVFNQEFLDKDGQTRVRLVIE